MHLLSLNPQDNVTSCLLTKGVFYAMTHMGKRLIAIYAEEMREERYGFTLHYDNDDPTTAVDWDLFFATQLNEFLANELGDSWRVARTIERKAREVEEKYG